MADLHPDANRWSAHLAGRLSRRDRRALADHVAACGECRQVFADLRLMTYMPAAPRPRLALLAAAWDTPVALVASALLIAAGVWWLGRPPLPPVPAAELPTLPVPASPALTRSRPIPMATKTAPAAPPSSLVALTTPPVPPGLLESDVAPPSPPAATSADFSPVLTGFLDQRPAADPYLQMMEAPNSPTAAPAANWAVGPSFANAPAQPAVNVSFGPQPQTSSSFAWSAPWGVIAQGGHALREVGSGVAQSVETIVPVLVPLIPGVHFLAIAHLGSRTWAAGRTDQIYESNDAGAHWRQVTLPASDVPAASVSAVRFSDPEHGLISAVDGRSWLTRDGGSTWTSQSSPVPVAH